MRRGTSTFDSIAKYYDDTRSPARTEEIDAIVKALGGYRTILDIGIGTGRLSKPLQDFGIDVTGVDLSVKMLEKAKEKGIRRLVIGDATNLPFHNKSFDVSIAVHVFHLVENRRKMMAEASRVTRYFVMSLFQERNHDLGVREERWKAITDAYEEARAKYGYPVDQHSAFKERYFEDDVMKEFPPYKKILIGEFVRERGPMEFIGRFMHSSRFVEILKDLPDCIRRDVINYVTEKIQSQGIVSDKSISPVYLSVWRPEDINRNITS